MSESANTRKEQLKRAQSLMASGDFDGARALADAILEDVPDNGDGLYIAAVAARYLKDFDAAAAYLSRLKAVSPDYGRAFQEEGHLLNALGEHDRALTAFQFATRYNPALLASWDAQVRLLQAQGRSGEAARAAEQSARLKALPKALLAVTNHIHEGRVLKAEELARAFLKKQPHHVEAMRLLADIGSRLGVHEDADILLEAATEIAPDNLQVRIDHIQVLRKRQKFAAASKAAKALLDREPGSPVFQSLYAIESMQGGDYDTALAMFDKVLEQLPGDPATLTSRGHALKTVGRSEEAVESYRAALEGDRLHGDAWYALANLKTYTFSSDEIAAMQAAQDDPNLSFMARVHIAFALGKAFEDAGEIDLSFENYAHGNALKRHQTRYTPEQMAAEFDAQKRWVTPELIKRQAGKGCEAPDPIFIVGMPRAGSTLLEQILASHSQVDGTLELPNILSTAHRLRGRSQLTDRERYPRVLGEMSADELRALGQEYIDTTQIHRQGAPFFTDKMPNNFRHIGLIHLILPNARIIDARRGAMDCCWSNFKQLFAEGQEFTYSLTDMADYYRGYVDLMDHWEAVLPAGSILRVTHEDVLEDLEGQVQRLLDFCELPFEQACVDFHKTDRAVRTASSEQVRQPISKSGLGQWRPFEAHLDPLKNALGDLAAADRSDANE
ncbi:MAG: sulfotransferase [Pseudomonadota bacterium]